MSGERNDVFACGVTGVDQQPVGRPAVAADDVVDHRLRQARIVAPVGHLDRDNDAFLRRPWRCFSSIEGGSNGAVGKAHEARLGIGRRSLGLLLFGLVLGPWVLARALRSASSRSSAARALAARSLHLARRPFLRALGRRRVEAPGSLASSCLRAASRSATAASILMSFSPVLNDSLLALARTFVPSTAISARLISPSAISAVTLCVSSRSRISACPTRKISEPVIIQRHAAGQPPTGSVLLWSSRRVPPLNPTPSTVA